jgi:signal transduction histidine kinase
MSNIDIRLDVSDDLPVINADEESLKEVFFNIIHNAIQAMSAGGSLTISASNEQESDYIKVIFKDTGTGISKENIDKIFEPFYTTKQAGTGLGLAIVKRKLEETGGMVHVESTNSTTKFTIKIPTLTSERVLVGNATG